MKKSKEKIFSLNQEIKFKKEIYGIKFKILFWIILKLEGIEKEDKNFKLIEHKDGKNFDGIIKYLQNQHGKNIHKKEIITLSSSSNGGSDYQPENAINYESDNYWFPNYNKIGEWWEINFKEKKVKMNGYSLQSYYNTNYI